MSNYYDDAGERLDECPSCGALTIEPEVFGACDVCRESQYGGDERHEKVRLFTPAPEPMKGQTTLEL